MGNIIGAIIALGILVTVHEAGHFLAARWFGVEIEKFSIGFGKKLFSFKKGKTEYRISLIPLGGYVKMKGENPDEEIVDPEHSFRGKTWWQRAIIAFAGPFANFVLALLLFIASFAVGRNYEDLKPVVGQVESEYAEVFLPEDIILEVNDHPIKGWNQIIQYSRADAENYYKVLRDSTSYEITTPGLESMFWYSTVKPQVDAVVGEVSPGLSAFKAGLMPGDRILAVDENPVADWYEMRAMITENPNSEVKLKIQRGEQVFDKVLKLEQNIYDDNKVIGITQYMPVKIQEKYNLGQSISYGSITTVNFMILNYAMFGKLIANPQAIKSNLGGPVMIYTMSKQTVGKGWGIILSFIAAISIVLMIMNLLPIPILDGGHIFFCFVEGIFRRPLPLKVQIILQNIGLFFLMFLMVYAFWNDFSRIFSRNASIQEQKMEMQK
ncbi:MAG: RIP metalloprotease RseP [Candidatus Cloacimonadales bacterium]|nr:RIP metalloprotease RseP [Candidatus Cloacimonadales bacterium]